MENQRKNIQSGQRPHYWHGRLDVGFVFSVPGSFEAAHGKPVFDATGEHLDLALRLHLVPALPMVFPSADRYDYRITNAHTVPIAKALGHSQTEADSALIAAPANIDRVRAELAGCRIVVLCGNKAELLGKCLPGFLLVTAGHTSMNGLNSRWPSKKQRDLVPGWDEMTGEQRTLHRIALWAKDVEIQCRNLLRRGAQPNIDEE